MAYKKPVIGAELDAAQVAGICTRASAEAIAFWPKRIPTSWSKEQIQGLMKAPGCRLYVDRLHTPPQGVFVCRPGYLPEMPATQSYYEPGGKAAELVIWYIEPGTAEPDYRAILHDLFDQWFTDEMVRGEFTCGFGVMPENMPAKTSKYLWDWVANGGVEAVKYVEDKVPWVRFWGHSYKDALERLP